MYLLMLNIFLIKVNLQIKCFIPLMQMGGTNEANNQFEKPNMATHEILNRYFNRRINLYDAPKYYLYISYCVSVLTAWETACLNTVTHCASGSDIMGYGVTDMAMPLLERV